MQAAQAPRHAADASSRGRPQLTPGSAYLTQVTTFLQTQLPDQLRGRVMSIYALCWNLLPVGGRFGGVLAAAVDARFAVLVGGALVAANALALLTSRRLRAIR